MKNGALVRFANYQPLPKHRVGHPRGLEWFCAEHLSAAKALTDLTSSEAIATLRQQFR